MKKLQAKKDADSTESAVEAPKQHKPDKPAEKLHIPQPNPSSPPKTQQKKSPSGTNN